MKGSRRGFVATSVGGGLASLAVTPAEAKPIEKSEPVNTEEMSTDIDDVLKNIDALVAEKAEPVEIVESTKPDIISTDIDEC